METMGKLIKMHVLIIGCRGLGVETAKNLTLAGPASVTIFDPNQVSFGDLSSNFYCREEDVGKVSRAEASISKLQELNPYVKVGTISSLTTQDLAKYNVVCVTENFESVDTLIEYNEFCRQNKIGFILSLAYGPSGIAFVDYGNNFTILDSDGEDTKPFIVVNIT